MALTEASESTYATDTNDVPLLNEGISSTAKHLTTSQSLLEDEARAWDEGVLEDFKKQRDTLVALRDMFDRRDRYAKDNIPQLQRRIENNEHKLAGLMGRPEGASIKPGEQEKLEQLVRAVGSPSMSVVFELILCRTNNPSSINMPVGFLSKNVSGTNSSSSNNLNITLANCIKTGVRSGLSMPSCKLTIGEP